MATIAAAAARCSSPTRRQLLIRRRLPFSVSFSAAPHAATAGFGWADALRVAGDGGRGDESDLSGYFRKVDICNRGMVSFSRAPTCARAIVCVSVRKPHMWLFAWGFYRTKRGSSWSSWWRIKSWDMSTRGECNFYSETLLRISSQKEIFLPIFCFDLFFTPSMCCMWAT